MSRSPAFNSSTALSWEPHAKLSGSQQSYNRWLRARSTSLRDSFPSELSSVGDRSYKSLDKLLNKSLDEPLDKSLERSRGGSGRSDRSPQLSFNQRLRGSLTSRDKRTNQRSHRFSDDYLLSGLETDQRLTLSLNSNQFDTYLQVTNTTTGRVVAKNDDARASETNSKVSFTVKAGVTYRVRVTSYEPKETGKYTLVVSTGIYNQNYGYGLVDAAAAIAKISGQPSFNPVADTGQWNLDMMNVPEAWSQGYTGEGVVVAVVDTGVDYHHPDLRHNLWANRNEIPNNGMDDDFNGFIDDVQGWNFVDGGSNDPLDLNGHGTHIAGAIAASNNDFGITGIAYNAEIMPVKVIGGSDDASLTQFDANLAAGIRYAVDNGANVLNLSLGNYPEDPPLPQTEAALQYARQAGVIAVMASGNEKRDGATEPIEPASYSRKNLGIAVGSIDSSRTVSDFSNPAGNRTMDFFVAPGVNIESTVPGGSYESNGWTGTSMSTAQVSGVVSLILSANPNLTPDQVEESLVSTANPTGIRVA
jgi:subtilisin family serine protease